MALHPLRRYQPQAGARSYHPNQRPVRDLSLGAYRGAGRDAGAVEREIGKNVSGER